MANAAASLQVHVETAGWVFLLSTLEDWLSGNPEGSIEDYLAECRKQTSAAKERWVEVEVENGSSRESAEQAARLMR